MNPSIHYSASTGGFHMLLPGTELPADAIEVPPAEHRALMDAQAAGGRIVADPDGRPRADMPAAPTVAERQARAVVAIKQEAERRILLVAPLWRQSNDSAAIAAELLARMEGSPPSDISAELGRRARIDAIRDASDAIEASVPSLSLPQLLGLDIAADRHWPEPAGAMA